MVEAIRQGDIPGVQLRVRQVLPHSIDDSWRWITEPDRVTRWICDRIEPGKPSPSGPTERWVTLEPDGASTTEVVHVVASQEPLKLELAFHQLSWDVPTHIRFEVGRGAPGDIESSEISILHRHFERLPLSDGLTVWEHYRRRWRGALDRLARASSG